MATEPQHAQEVYAATRVDALYRLRTERLTPEEQAADLERLADRMGIPPYDPDAPPRWQDPFESDEEYAEFLVFLREIRGHTA